MIIRLSNLSTRPPVLDDLSSVTALVARCDLPLTGLAEVVEEDINRRWFAPGFQLATDAWTIITHTNDIISYADIHSKLDGQTLEFEIFLRVHPAYRHRGIETLLIWLIEERARQILEEFSDRLRVVLSIALPVQDQSIIDLFEHQGYLLTHTFWRLLFEHNAQQQERFSSSNRQMVDLVIETTNLQGDSVVRRQTGIYSARQYGLYEKIIREPVAQMKKHFECEELLA
ncbi:GNAT family N-acetyltransferase [Tengunoibacter tsumagoiensis]|uniref:N-acetyltransferase domain-containing protein n=1 Tax=Tengunoibacter tsumagoiensis TaxID=2014871 RepID=A0A401ZYC5_9CHLR|nr:GNAT family N-acetyltransferase [Tengunoibacter tsumagoiensis]GCE11845.1 hypothetical protein KTT_17040 [Tengunoibacter tsumagoiensis]